jgi:hypothetical protein
LSSKEEINFMKQTLLSRLILAGLAGAALSAAHAGQIQSSSVAIAREVVTTNTQSILAPTISYRFAGDVDARGQAQTFQVQFTLAAGTWATLPGTPEKAIKVTNGITNTTANQSAVIVAGNATYQVSTVALSADKKTLFATITVAQDPVDGLLQQPIVSINATTNLIANATVNTTAFRASLTNLFDVTGDIVADFVSTGACSANKTLSVSFAHYTALTAPSVIATVANATADEHNRGGATNTATLVVFPTNITVSLATSTSAAFLTPGGNLTFTDNGANPADPLRSFVSASLANLGSFKLTQNATGYDSDLANQYVLAGVAGGAYATGLDAIAVAANNVGDVEVKSIDVKVTPSNGVVVGGSLFISAPAAGFAVGAACGAPLASSVTTITTANAAGPINVSVTAAADVNAAFGPAGTKNAFLCYQTPGGVTIPSSSFTATATLVKAAAGGNNAEQNNVCNGSFYSLGGGLKIDVRNYASSAETSGYMSVLRFINNSDAAAADVWAQFVHQDGKLGNWAKIADLPVRGVVNMTAPQIDAKLAAGNAATVAAANKGTAAPVAQAATATTSDTAPRLRITSTTGRSLRVQNYLFNRATGQILEGSGEQGVDFEGTATRAPASEGQYQGQDANSGLNLAN